MINLLQQLVETESPSTGKAAVDSVGAIVAKECRKLGAQGQSSPTSQHRQSSRCAFPCQVYGGRAAS